MANSYEGFYGGAGSTFNSEYSIGFKMGGNQLGFPGSAQTANQLGETVNAIKHGTKTFEVSMVDPNVTETIPIQHFEEMRALMKLTGVKPSVHGPIIDAAGFGEQGWTPDARKDNERRLFGAIEKAQALDPSGNLPIVLHSSNGAPGAEWRPGNEKKGENKIVMEKATMINQDSGQTQVAKREEKWRPEVFSEKRKKDGEYGKPIMFDVEGSVGSANLGDWESKLTEVAQMNKHAEELIGAAPMNLAEYNNSVRVRDGKIKKLKEDDKGILILDKTGSPIITENVLPEITSETQVASHNQMRKAGLFLDNAELSFKGTFGQAYKYGSDKQRKVLEKLANNYTKDLDVVGDMVWNPIERQRLLDTAIGNLQEITADRALIKNGKVVRDSKGDVMRDKDWGTPGVWELTENFAMEKAAKTFGNLAARSHDKFGEKAPVLAIENMFQGMAFSRAEDMRDLVKMSRENFVKHLVDDGMSENKAEKLAEDKLGVTWDVGHLNVMRKKGFTEKDVIEQTKIMTKDKSMVKHVHLTDNFGYADTHLAPGMGNVPIKGILEELEKTGRFDEMRKIVEAPGFIQHFKVAPHSMTLAAFGSGIYGMKYGPTWDQAINIQGAYFGGYGNLNPQTHHSYFGAGFTTMPVELGGQMPGGQSRFGGAPMA